MSDIDVGSSQGVVTLIGRVKSQAIKDTAERLALKEPLHKPVR